MNQELIQRIEKLEQIINTLVKPDRYMFEKGIELATGQSLKTNSGSKVGLFGVVPVVQQAAIAQVSGGATQDTNARTALNSLLTELHNLGLIA